MRRTMRALRHMAGAMIVVLLSLAPVVVGLTHGPGAGHPAGAATAQDPAHAVAGLAGSEAADHEHQTQAEAPEVQAVPVDPRSGIGARSAADGPLNSTGPEGLRRPPRLAAS